MPTIELTDDQYERFRSICADLEATYVGEYGAIRERDAVDYLLDTYTPPGALATADGAREHAAPTVAGATADADIADDPDAADEPDDGSTGSASGTEDDLTTVTGIGETKAAALEEAGFETVADLHAATVDALATVDGIGEDLAAEIKVALDTEHAEVGAPGGGSDDDAGGSADGSGSAGGGDAAAGSGSGPGNGGGGGDHDDGATRLESMMSLLDEHDDVWRESGGDEPYEVELPDGSLETARTKDHVRQLLFQHYR
jgi:predicted flap endonuclease-1-like 5' DNA nuclease